MLFTSALTFAVATNLFTTDRDCSSWSGEAWANAGYSPVCLNNSVQQQIVHRHCWYLPKLVIQYSDIARLLVLYENGGWYVDSDVSITPRCYHTKEFANTTFGLEADLDDDVAANWNMEPRSLALWAIYGVKGDPMLKSMACQLARQSSGPVPPESSIDEYEHHILATSGPLAQTRIWNGTVAPIGVFGCGQDHSHSPPCTEMSCWGCHSFKGRWRVARPRWKPVWGICGVIAALGAFAVYRRWRA